MDNNQKLIIGTYCITDSYPQNRNDQIIKRYQQLYQYTYKGRLSMDVYHSMLLNLLKERNRIKKIDSALATHDIRRIIKVSSHNCL